jgi:hypothetical protein
MPHDDYQAPNYPPADMPPANIHAASQPAPSLNMPDDFEMWTQAQKQAWFAERRAALRASGAIPRYPKTVGDYLRVAEATIWLLAVKLLTAKVSQPSWERFLGVRGHATAEKPLSDAMHEKAFRVQRAVGYSIQHLPGTGRRFNCLVRAVTSKWLLALRGIPTTLYLGEQEIIRDDGNRRIRKHAWLRCGDRVVSGWGPHVKDFTEVARFGSRRDKTPE